MPSNDVVFEGDEGNGRGVRGESPSPIAVSPIVNFLLRQGVTRSERRARLLVGLVAVLALVATGWVSRGAVASEPPGRRYADLSPAERAALPPKQRIQLDQIEAARAERFYAPSATAEAVQLKP